MEKMKQQYGSLEELCIMAGVKSKNTLRYNPKFKEMCQGIRIGKRRVVYSIDEFQAYLESNRVQ